MRVEFDFAIRDVIRYKNSLIVLLDIPFNELEINNLYKVSEDGIVWQSEDLNKLYPNQENLPYEQMILKGDKILASDFYGRRYFIKIGDGMVVKKDCVK